MGKKGSKTFMLFQIIWFQLVSVNCLYYLGNTRSSQSMCYQTDLNSYIWLKISYSNSIWFRMIKKLDKSTFVQISGVFETRLHFHCQMVFRKKLSYAFKWAHFLDSITSEILDLWGFFFFSEHGKFNLDSKNGKKVQQNF